MGIMCGQQWDSMHIDDKQQTSSSLHISWGPCVLSVWDSMPMDAELQTSSSLHVSWGTFVVSNGTACRAETKKKKKTMPFGINSMRSQVLYQVAQALGTACTWMLTCKQTAAFIPAGAHAWSVLGTACTLDDCHQTANQQQPSYQPEPMRAQRLGHMHTDAEQAQTRHHACPAGTFVALPNAPWQA